MRLSIQIEFDKTLDLETNKTDVIVGRSPKCDLVIPHDAISRQHCKIEYVKGHYYITDLGSANGVSIDGQKIEPNIRRAFLPTQQLSFGTMECEISESRHKVPDEHKVVSSNQAGDFTATIRLARLDLNKPSKTLELEKQVKVRGPRNPIAGQKEPEVVVKRGHGFKIILVLLAVAAIAAAWFLAPSSK